MTRTGILRRQSRLRESADFLLLLAKVAADAASLLWRQNPCLRTRGVLSVCTSTKEKAPRRVLFLWQQLIIMIRFHMVALGLHWNCNPQSEKCNPHNRCSTNWNLTLHQTEISHCFIQLRKINGHIHSLILILCGYATAHTLG